MRSGSAMVSSVLRTLQHLCNNKYLDEHISEFDQLVNQLRLLDSYLSSIILAQNLINKLPET